MAWIDYILYRSWRVGKDGKLFTMYKFRSMVRAADQLGGHSTALNDPRLTRLGRMMRRLKLDELPQLVNILKGDMAFVGPRPEVPCYVNRMPDSEKNIVLSVKPGLVDYASLYFINEDEILEQAKAKGWQEEVYYLCIMKPWKTQLQVKYVREKSFRTDIKIILWTILLLSRSLFHFMKLCKASAPLKNPWLNPFCLGKSKPRYIFAPGRKLWR